MKKGLNVYISTGALVFVLFMVLNHKNGDPLGKLCQALWSLLWKPALALCAAFALYLGYARYEMHQARQEAACTPDENASYDTAVQIPQGVIDAYYDGRMTADHKLEFACHVRAMVAKVPTSVEKDLLAYYKANH